ncbi:NAD(P)/FAD-dependent oxidoreductase [Marinivivus vitaminiproducens]|uniref:NAD(P)/FAD-dependent oxidoreductase n=1 Tax=Marinivivus vitaminiproducens TaxID=3035935 RepID=UPI0027A3AE6B|nr:FAD-binding oxidoreductase [Geminicoccaceae bacterium SCSIO 64248]
MNAHDIVIAGGGLHGLSAAYFLAKRGMRVVLLEKDRFGHHASGRNAGGVRRLGRNLAEIPLSLASLDLWQRLPELIGTDGGFRASSQVRVAETEADLAALEARVALMRQHGYAHEELIGPDELYRLMPALAPGCPGGIITRGDGFADPLATSLGFARAARRAGAELVEGATVVAIESGGGGWRVTTAQGETYQAPHVLNAAGAWGDRIAAMTGDAVPLRFAAYMMTITTALPAFLTPVALTTSRPLSFKQLASGAALIGGGYEGTGDRDTGEVRCDPAGIAANVATALDLFPVLKEATIVRSWCGLEGVLDDQLPVLGASPIADGVFHAFGFSGHGFQLGPGTGAMLAELIATGATDFDLSPFRADRFTKPAGASDAPERTKP